MGMTIELLLKLVFCHLIGDYVLQSDFIAKTKGETVTDFADRCRECGARISGGIRNGFDNSNNCNSSSTFVGNN